MVNHLIGDFEIHYLNSLKKKPKAKKLMAETLQPIYEAGNLPGPMAKQQSADSR